MAFTSNYSNPTKIKIGGIIDYSICDKDCELYEQCNNEFGDEFKIHVGKTCLINLINKYFPSPRTSLGGIINKKNATIEDTNELTPLSKRNPRLSNVEKEILDVWGCAI
jgi:hypothetical protein